MNENMRKAYEVLRAKDEIEASWGQFLPPAIAIATMAAFAVMVEAWLVTAIALPVAALFGMLPKIMAAVCSAVIKRMGFSEIELERIGLG